MRRQKLISKEQFESILAQGEQAFNLVGYIPFVSIISASVRSVGGLLQMTLGFCFALGYFCVFFYKKSRNIKHFFYLKTSFIYALHGIANFFRAKIEAIPCLSLLFCLPYDRYFKKRFKYTTETLPKKEADIETIEI